MSAAFIFLLLSETVQFSSCRSHFHLTEWEISALHSLTPINESIKPCSWIYFFPTPCPTPLSFSFFHFLASDTSSSSLSRTESPLQVFVSSHLPHPKSDTFVWPHAASPCCDQVPEPRSPSHCKLVFSS